MSYNGKKAQLVWEGQGVGFKASGASGYTMRFDNPSGLNAASPMEVVAMAAGACTAMDVIDILRKKRQQVTGFEVNVLALRAAEHPMVFTEVNLEYVVRGRKVDLKAVERAIQLSLTKYCSVNNMLKHTAKIRHQCRIVEETQTVPAA